MSGTWKTLLLVYLALLPIGIAEQAAALSSLLAEMPECAATCLGRALSNSPCTATNQTCMCTNKELQAEADLCVANACTIKESLVAQNLTSTSCGIPVRNKGRQYFIIANTLVAIASLCVIQRFVSKLYLNLDLGLDDWFILITVLGTVSSVVINIRGASANGLGCDVWTLAPDQITKFLRSFYVLSILYVAQMTFLKMAMLFFYRRIFTTSHVKKMLWGTVAYNVLSGITFLFAVIFQCEPISYSWHRWDGEHQGHCADMNAIAWANAANSIAVDIWMLAVPLSQIRTLQLDWKKKAGVGMMFLVGSCFTIISIVRLHAIVQFGKSTNLTWDYLAVTQWSTVEINVGIICACMPALRVLLVRLFPRALGTPRQYHGNYDNNAIGSGHSRSKKSGANTDLRGDASHWRAEEDIATPPPSGVGYGDDDETQLVNMKIRDLPSSRSEDQTFSLKRKGTKLGA